MTAVPSPPPQQPQAPAFPTPVQRQPTQPPFTVGIAAGAEDVKYQAKYKDLKRKVKEIEADNDKLHFKVLQAKRSIQRMKLERAVLYERLSAVPPSPELQDRHALPPVHPGSSMPPQMQHHIPPPNHLPRDMDRTPPDYIRQHPGNHRPDGRPPMDSPMAPGPPSAHGPQSSRRGSLAGPDPRQIQFMQHIPPIPQDLNRGHPQIHASPLMHHPNASHEHTRSPSRSRGHPTPQMYHAHPQQYPESVQQVQHPLHSPPLSERGRGRRHDIHELTSSHIDSRGRHPNSMPPLSPASDARRIHNHQRMGPGTYINRDDILERGRDWEREREQRERGRARDAAMRSPPLVHRSRPIMDRNDYPDPPHMVPRRRDEQGYFAERRGGYSRSSSAGSGSGSGSAAGDPPSRPDSRAQYYEPDRSRSYRLRPVAQTEDVDFVHEDGLPQSRDRGGGGGGGGGGYVPEQSRPPLDSRKRSRNDMDVDDADDGPPGGMYSRHSDAEPRGSKRYHPTSDRM